MWFLSRKLTSILVEFVFDPVFHMYPFMLFTKLTPVSSDMVSPMSTTYQTSTVFYEMSGSSRDQ